ncbi:hypothetical protein ABE438_14305 [Bosea sp. TWI1241]|uniref:hypothetical protein n=1 Tax=Bosea sp. TWI1241 TaxID=3148904 RepID=UPI00320AD9F0
MTAVVPRASFWKDRNRDIVESLSGRNVKRVRPDGRDEADGSERRLAETLRRSAKTMVKGAERRSGARLACPMVKIG